MHIVLVTDLVVLLTERDQKYFVPAILDLKVSTEQHVLYVELLYMYSVCVIVYCIYCIYIV